MRWESAPQQHGADSRGDYSIATAAPRKARGEAHGGDREELEIGSAHIVLGFLAEPRAPSP
jgi:hypothetical protein